MGAEQQKSVLQGFKSTKPAAYYWRLMGREVYDHGKLLKLLGYLYQEPKAHQEKATVDCIWSKYLRCADEVMSFVLDRSASSLQDAVSVLICNLEVFWRCFREYRIWLHLILRRKILRVRFWGTIQMIRI